jgi:hypothetical protein
LQKKEEEPINKQEQQVANEKREKTYYRRLREEKL